MSEHVTAASEAAPGFRERFWAGLPEKIQFVLVVLACILALAAAFAPLVYLLRRIGVG